eukprot:1748009-Pyramimonas_sp.AAC.1
MEGSDKGERGVWSTREREREREKVAGWGLRAENVWRNHKGAYAGATKVSNGATEGTSDWRSRRA